MARLRSLDLMQSFQFWLLDVTPTLNPPFLVLGGASLGFSNITAPEVTLETREIPQLNNLWKRHQYTGATVSPITLSRGARSSDDSMWDWIENAMRGSDVATRTLMLIHSTGSYESALDLSTVVGLSAGLVNPVGAIAALAAPSEQEARRVPGRMWVLWDTIPIAYKAGTDFDAASGDVSIMEITLQPYAINEFGMQKTLPF